MADKKTIKSIFQFKLKNIASLSLAILLVLSNAPIARANTNEAVVEKVNDAKQSLVQKVDEFKKVDLSFRTEETVTAFKDALTSAQELLEKQEATNEELTQALEVLVNAKTALKFKTEGLSVKPSTKEEIAATAKAEKIDEGNTLETGTTFRSSANQLNVEILKGDGSPIAPGTVYDGNAGDNMTFKVRVTLQENAEDQKVEIILGNFLRFADTGANNESVKQFVDSVSAVEYGDFIKSLDGRDYIDHRGGTFQSDTNFKANHKVVYNVKPTTTSFDIPLTISAVNNIFGIKGFSKTGSIEGSEEGIEITTPITVKVLSTKNTQLSEKTVTLDEIKTPNYRIAVPDQNFNGSILESNHFTVATNTNNYEVVIAYQYGYIIHQDGSYGQLLSEEDNFDLVLPNGVSFVGFADRQGLKQPSEMFEVTAQEENPESPGGKIVKIKQKFPGMSAQFPFIKVRIDRNIITQDFVQVKVGNHKIKRRHYRDFDHSSSFPTAQLRTYTINIVDTTPQDDIGWHVKIGMPVSTDVNVTNGKQARPGDYSMLGRFYFNNKIINLDNHDSRFKELHYSFPENPNFEVKGFMVLRVDNGYMPTQIKVRSKEHPDWKTVPFVEGTTGGKYRNVTLHDLGLNESDVLLEAVYSVGKFEANRTYNLISESAYGGHHVFGTIKNPNAGKKLLTANVTLRDENYDAGSSDHNYVTGTTKFYANIEERNNLNSTNVQLDSVKNIAFGQTGNIRYRVYANPRFGYEYTSTEEVEKIYLVLPTDLKVKNVRFVSHKPGNKEFTNLVVKESETTTGDKTIRTYSFANVGDDKYIGRAYRYNERGSEGIYINDFSVYVDIENDVNVTKDIPYDQTLFVQTVSERNTISSHTLSTDPYNFVDNDKKLFTNTASTSYVRLTKADVLDLTTDAKLTTDNGYLNANSEFKINNITQDLQVKINISNPTENEVGEIDLYLPIPKQGKSFGENFQNEAFGFGFALKGVDKDSEFDSIFDVSYATLPESELNGTRLTTEQLSQKQFSNTQSSTTNLIRIKTKDNVKVPAQKLLAVVLQLGLENPSTNQDGKTIVWNPYYKARFADGSKTLKARDINISITLGKTGVKFFEDTNANGQLDNNENKFANDVVFTVGNDLGQTVNIANSLQKTAQGIVINGLTSGKTYTITASNENNTTYRFTTGNKATNSLSTAQNATASLTDAGSVNYVLVGLTPKIVLQDPAKTKVNDANALTAEENAKVVKAVKDANNNLPQNTFVTADNKGVVTVRYPDGFEEKIPAAKTVVEREVSAQPTITPINSKATTLSGTGVEGAKITVVIGSTRIDNITVGPGNTWTTGLPSAFAKDTPISVVQTENDKKPSLEATDTVKETEAEKEALNMVAPQKVEVVDLNQLTDPEKEQVKTNIRTANTANGINAKIQTIDVSPNGTTTVRFNDGSEYVFQPSETVEKQGESTPPGINTIKSNATTITGTGINGSEIKVMLPTGGAPLTATVNGNTWSVNVPSNVKLTAGTFVRATQKQPSKAVSSEVSKEIVKTDAEKATLKNPTITRVNSLTALTTQEKTAVKNAVKAANTSLADSAITVDANGKVTVRYNDGSMKYIEPAYTVALKETSALPFVNQIYSNDTKITGTGQEGATIEVKLPGGQKLTAQVQNGAWSVNLPNTLAANSNVEVIQKENNKFPSTKVTRQVAPTQAESITPNNPTKVVVDNINALSASEKEQVKKAVETANASVFPPLTSVVVSNNGNVTITYPDGTQDNIVPVNTVTQKPTSATPTVDSIKSSSTTLGGTGVAGATIVVTLQDGTKLAPVTVQAGSNRWSVTLPKAQATGATISVVQTETGKKPSAEKQTIVLASDAEAANLTAPTPVVVDNVNNLSASDIQKVEQAIRNANPTVNTINTITVETNGKTTVKFNDLSTKVFEQNETVTNRDKSTAPTINKVDTDDLEITGTNVANATVSVTLPSGEVKQAVVTGTTWSVTLTEPLAYNTRVSATQTETNKLASDPTHKNVEKTTADLININNPTTKVKVDDLQNLTPTEQDAVKAAVTAANNSVSANITVDNKGKVTITFPDGSKKFIEPAYTVELKELSSVPFVNKVDSNDTTVTGTGVAGATIEVKVPNVASPITTTVEADGTWSVDLPNALATNTNIEVVQKEDGKRASNTVIKKVVPTQAEAYNFVTPLSKVKVDDLAQLTPAEKDQVKQAIEAVNNFPPKTTVSVKNNGDVVITFEDGSEIGIPATDLVELRETSATPTVNTIDTDDMKVEGTGVDGATIKVTLPNNAVIETTVVGGKWSVDLLSPLPVGAVVSVVQVETDKKPSAAVNQTVQLTQAESITPNLPADKVVVDDVKALSDVEKDKVKTAVIDANVGNFPVNTVVKVNDNGDVVITYPDMTTDTILAKDVVSQRETTAKPTVKPLNEHSDKVEGTGVDGALVEVKLPGGVTKVVVVDKGVWSVDLDSRLKPGQVVSVVQTEAGKFDSPVVDVVVTAVIVPTSPSTSSKHTLPKSGVAGNTAYLGVTLLAAATAIFGLSKRKKEEE